MASKKEIPSEVTGGSVVTYAAVDKVVECVLESPKESRYAGGTYVRWGEKNTYPQFLDNLFRNAPTLRSVILGTVDYVTGNAVNATRGLQGSFVDRRRTTWQKFIKKTAQSVAEWGGYAWKVTRSRDNTAVVELEVLPLKFLRTDEDTASFWYNEKWGTSNANVTQYPAWVPGTLAPESVYFVKLWGDETYPEPVYAASVKEAAAEMAIADFHVGNLERGFMGSYIINLCNGVVTNDKQKAENERGLNEKFAGHRNAGRIMINYCTDAAHRAILEKMEVADYGDKYETLSKHCRQQIFTAFRANPNLFGVATESNGFNSEEFESSFKLFNRTMIQPIQQEIIDGLEAILEPGIISIEPFTLDGVQKEVE